MNRRKLVLSAAALLAASVSPAAAGRRFDFRAVFGAPPRSARYAGKRIVAFATDEKPGTVIISTRERALYFVLGGGKAIRYGVGVGRAGFQWSGVARVGAKKPWPTWRPPKEMIARELRQYGRRLPDVMAGGPNNPLGARAIYLFKGKRDTMYRIHGTNAPQSIGRAVSSGCIRMLNEEVFDLYERVRVGAKVIVM